MNRYVINIKNYFMSIGVKQFVAEPTRVTNTSETLIDYVITNRKRLTNQVHAVPKITDHSLIESVSSKIVQIQNFTF